MGNELKFQFQIPKPPDGPLVEISNAEAEKLLLQKLSDTTGDQTQALWELAQFYKLSKQHEKALERLRQLIALLPDAEQKAECVLTMGQAMEQVGDWHAAIRYYREALSLEPTKTFTWYFINNNLGFCLNTVGQFADGEQYCRDALQIDAHRPNAHKNLGIALAGQGDYPGAARCYLAATQANAADPRAARLLRELIQQHPELEYDFGELLATCERAVQAVGQKGAQMKPVIHRGWRKQLILLQARTRSLLKKIFKSSP